MTKSNNGQLSLFPELSNTDQETTTTSDKPKKTGDIRVTVQLKTKELEEWLKTLPPGGKFTFSLKSKGENK